MSKNYIRNILKLMELILSDFGFDIFEQIDTFFHPPAKQISKKI